MKLTHFKDLCDPQGRREHLPWACLVDRFSHARVCRVKERAPGLSLATFHGDYRKLDRVELVYAIGIDLDAITGVSTAVRREPGAIVEARDWPSITMLFDGVDAILHTTWSSTTDEPRARVFIRLSRPVTGPEYRRVFAAVAARCEELGLVVDRQASDPSRFWFVPSIPPGGHYAFSIGRGRPIHVERILARVPRPPVLVAPPASARPRPTSGVADLEARVAAYLARCEPAIQGSGGDKLTFITAQRIVRGFDLDEETAFRLLLDWNARCQPPWTEHALRRKVREAWSRGTLPIGSLRDAQFRRAS